jgi:MFS superfamily sulfate permease-like transporter
MTFPFPTLAESHLFLYVVWANVADWLRPDIVGALTTGAVIIPKAMAYVMTAGLAQ